MLRMPLILCLIAAPLCAQTPEPQLPHPVRILLQTEKPPLGTPALDTSILADRLKAFAKAENLVPPTPDGDGWIVGVGLTTQKEMDGLLVGGGTIRLTPIRHGKTAPEEAKESGVLVVAWKSLDLCNALGDELAWRSRDLLAAAHAVPKEPPIYKVSATDLGPQAGQADSAHPRVFDFSQVTMKSQPQQPPYPVAARKNHVQGTVVIELFVDPTGTPVSAAAISGPGPLLAYACEYALRWRFNPLTQNGHPESGRFRLTLNFRLNN